MVEVRAPDRLLNAAASDGLWGPAQRRLTVGLALSTTLVATEALAVITIMPSVARDLGGLRLYGWVFASFMLAGLVGGVAAGRQADRAGPARPFVIGLSLFAAGLLVGGLAPSMLVLVCGRVLQGVGAGAIGALDYVAVGRGLPGHLRARMLAVLSSAWVLPGLIGPVLSAEVSGLLGWRWVFLGLTPLVAVAGLIVLPALTRLGRPSARTGAEHRLLDAFRAALGSGVFIAGLSSHTVLTAAALLLAGTALALPALRRLLPAGTLVSRRGLPAVVLSRGLLTFAFFGADAFITLTIVTVRHHSTALASVSITACTLAWTAGSWLQVRLNRSWEGRRQVRAGLLLVLGGIAGMLVSLRSAVPVGEAVVAWTVAGMGMGLSYAPTSLMTLHEAPSTSAGWASAALNLSDVLGTALGTGFGGAALAVGAARGWPMSTSVALAFGLAAAGAAVALVLTRRLPLHGVARARDETRGELASAG